MPMGSFALFENNDEQACLYIGGKNHIGTYRMQMVSNFESKVYVKKNIQLWLEAHSRHSL